MVLCKWNFGLGVCFTLTFLAAIASAEDPNWYNPLCTEVEPLGECETCIIRGPTCQGVPGSCVAVTGNSSYCPGLDSSQSYCSASLTLGPNISLYTAEAHASWTNQLIQQYEQCVAGTDGLGSNGQCCPVPCTSRLCFCGGDLQPCNATTDQEDGIIISSTLQRQFNTTRCYTACLCCHTQQFCENETLSGAEFARPNETNCCHAPTYACQPNNLDMYALDIVDAIDVDTSNSALRIPLGPYYYVRSIFPIHMSFLLTGAALASCLGQLPYLIR